CSFGAHRSTPRSFRVRGSSAQSFRVRGSSARGIKARILKDRDLLARICVMRQCTNLEDASLTAVFEDGVNETVLSMDEFAALKAAIMKEVPEGAKRGAKREDALRRIGKLSEARRPPVGRQHLRN